jgi:inorganic phosphate transporter, PiT family
MRYLILFVVILLACANGANDNFKGVATLLGGGVTSYRNALLWGTLTTFCGAMTAALIAHGLLATFSGSGLVPATVAASPRFGFSVVTGAALTVLLAARLGLPISTTHSLVGGLIGAGYLASASGVSIISLWHGVFVPLLFSPIVALLLALGAYSLFSFGRKRLGIGRETCVCVGNKTVGVVPSGIASVQALAALELPAASVGKMPACRERYIGRVVGLEAGSTVDALHYLSAGAVSFARGLNDTPKIAAMLLLVPGLGSYTGIAIVAVGMAIGGLIGARRVADTMAHRITEMNAGQAFSANLVTAFLVVVASRFGAPVSTTQVSVGALFGIGMVTRRARLNTIANVVLSWVITLPVAAALSSGVYLAIRATAL